MGNFGRYYVSKLITDEDFRNKNLIILIALVSIFSLIITTIISLPSIIIEGVFGENMEDIEYMRLYQDSIIPLEEECRQWVKKQEEKYSSYDSVSIRYDFSLTWYDLVSIDAVRYKQDFSNVTKSDVEDIAKKFIYKDVKTETYRVTVTRKR